MAGAASPRKPHGCRSRMEWAVRRGLGPALATLAAVALLALSRSCSAQNLARNWEAGLLFSSEVTTGDTCEPGYRLVRSLGYFYTDTWEFGGAIGIIGPFDAPPSSLLTVRVDHHSPLGTATVP